MSLGLLQPIVAPEYTYVIGYVFRSRNRHPRKGPVEGRITIMPGVAWVFENAVIWTGGQDDNSVLLGAREVLNFAKGKKGFGAYVGPILMMCPIDYAQITYSFTAGDPGVEHRWKVRDYDKKHHVKKIQRLRMNYPLEKFKGSTPPKPMPKEQREKISRSLRNRRREAELISAYSGEAGPYCPKFDCWIDDDLIHRNPPKCIEENKGCGNCPACRYATVALVDGKMKIIVEATKRDHISLPEG